MKIKVRYIGEDMAEIRKRDICEAHDVKGQTLKGEGELLAVIDRSGESYIYPKRLFEIIEE